MQTGFFTLRVECDNKACKPRARAVMKEPSRLHAKETARFLGWFLCKDGRAFCPTCRVTQGDARTRDKPTGDK